MSSANSKHSPGDYVAMVFSPLLIMALVGSLVFFLLEVLYAGVYSPNLRWILFCFVFGAVLVARISLQADLAGRATVYGLALGFVMWLALLRFVEYPPGSVAEEMGAIINLGLIALIWWCSYKLTWDCTFLDDTLGATGVGVLQAAGLEGDADPANQTVKKQDEQRGWIERYKDYREKQKARRTPGVWVIYFSLAALPLFGLGQSLIPADAADRRNYTFWLMGIYVASALGLLMTTSFLGLRIYLRRRNLQMPVAMTGVWLTAGGLAIAALLVVGALLPRPQAEVKLFDLNPAGSETRHASNQGREDGGAGKGEGNPKSDPKNQNPNKDKNPDGKGGTPDRDAKNPGATKDKKPAPGEKDKPGNGSGKDKQDPSGKGGKKDKDGQKGNETKGDQDPANEGDNPPPERTRSSPKWLGSVASVLKWIIFAVLLLVTLFFVLRGLLQFLANFSGGARRLLESLRRFWDAFLALFGRKPEEGDVIQAEAVEEDPIASQPFAAFGNPFTDGRAYRMSAAELIRYVFAALQSWARERDLTRSADETPFEFAARLAEEVPPLDEEVRELASLYARAVYSRGELPEDCRDLLEHFWDMLNQTTAQQLSA